MTDLPQRKTIATRLGWLALFATAMGLLEAIVVVYLRTLFFPRGFSFPLRSLSPRMLGLEMLRELCTLVILAAVAAVAARRFLPRLACFLYSFGIWDLAYYVFLKVLLAWPPSLFTWDVLFLIPVVWDAPVLAPIVCALTMIFFSLLLLRLDTQGLGPPKAFWVLTTIGSILIFIAFVADYGRIAVAAIAAGSPARVATLAAAFVPQAFLWGLFWAGETLLLLACALVGLGASGRRA